MNKITEGLYVGDIRDASNTKQYYRYEIDAAVKLSHKAPDGGYLDHVEVHDHSMIDGPQNDQGSMTEAVRATADLLSKGETVFVHCSAGASRSPSVAAAALAVLKGVDVQEAGEQVRDARQIQVHPDVWENAQRAVEEVKNDG